MSIRQITRRLALAAAACSITWSLAGNDATAAPVQIALWTFEAPNVPVPSTGVTSGPWNPAVGVGSASGVHASAATGWSNPVGNGSTESFSSNNWAIGDYYEFQVATTGLSGLAISFDQTRSSTGPSDFDLQYRAGSSGAFTTFQSYVVPSASWSSTAPLDPPTTTFAFDLSTVTGLENQSDVYFRLTATSAPSSTGGTNRIDNVSVTAVPEPSSMALASCGVCLAAAAAYRRRGKRTAQTATA